MALNDAVREIERVDALEQVAREARRLLIHFVKGYALDYCALRPLAESFDILDHISESPAVADKPTVGEAGQPAAGHSPTETT